GLVKSGSGTVSLFGSVDLGTGDASVQAGLLRLNAPLTAGNAFVLHDVVTGDATLQTLGAPLLSPGMNLTLNEGVANLAGNESICTLPPLGGGTLQVASSVTLTTAQNPDLHAGSSDREALPASGLVKSGSGTVSLSGVVDLGTGNASVGAGLLQLNATLSS